MPQFSWRNPVKTYFGNMKICSSLTPIYAVLDVLQKKNWSALIKKNGNLGHRKESVLGTVW